MAHQGGCAVCLQASEAPGVDNVMPAPPRSDPAAKRPTRCEPAHPCGSKTRGDVHICVYVSEGGAPRESAASTPCTYLCVCMIYSPGLLCLVWRFSLIFTFTFWQSSCYT